jgi:hypothetical protein
VKEIQLRERLTLQFRAEALTSPTIRTLRFRLPILHHQTSGKFYPPDRRA